MRQATEGRHTVPGTVSGGEAHVFPEAQRRYMQVLCDDVEMSSACPGQGVESELLRGPGSGAQLFGPHFICLNAITWSH